MYERTKCFCGDSIEVEEHHSGRYGAPGMKRQEKKRPTPEQMARQNQWRKERDIRRLLKTNFGEYDYWLTLTYRQGERPESIGEAKEQAQKFLRRMRSFYKGRGHPLKYIIVTEIGSRGGVHHHIVMSRIEGGDVAVAKNWPHGHPQIGLLYTEGGFRKLAGYIAKQEGRAKWYSRSRNLKKPRIVKQVMRRRTFSEEIRVPKGYYLEKGSVWSGVNPVTGHPYRYYTLVRINRRC